MTSLERPAANKYGPEVPAEMPETTGSETATDQAARGGRHDPEQARRNLEAYNAIRDEARLVANDAARLAEELMARQDVGSMPYPELSRHGQEGRISKLIPLGTGAGIEGAPPTKGRIFVARDLPARRGWLAKVLHPEASAGSTEHTVRKVGVHRYVDQGSSKELRYARPELQLQWDGNGFGTKEHAQAILNLLQIIRADLTSGDTSRPQ